MRPAVGGPVGVAVAGLFSLVLSGSDCRLGPIEACTPEIFPTARVELRLLEPYVEGGAYEWRPFPVPETVVTCDGRDGLTLGSYEFVAEDRSGGGFGCIASVLITVSPIGDVTFPLDQVRPLGLLASTQVPYFGGFWKLGVQDLSPETSPFGEVATPGRLPPVRVTREILGGTRGTCFDQWVGEIRVLRAGEEAGSVDGGAT